MHLDYDSRKHRAQWFCSCSECFYRTNSTISKTAINNKKKLHWRKYCLMMHYETIYQPERDSSSHSIVLYCIVQFTKCHILQSSTDSYLHFFFLFDTDFWHFIIKDNSSFMSCKSWHCWYKPQTSYIAFTMYIYTTIYTGNIWW